MIVLDCSAAMAIVLNHAEGDVFNAQMEDYEEVVAPDIFCLELCNALKKHVSADQFDIEDATKLLSRGICLVDRFCDSRELIQDVLRESVRLDHPAYDVAYLLLAKRCMATVFTLDHKLANLCRENGVSCICGEAA